MNRKSFCSKFGLNGTSVAISMCIVLIVQCKQNHDSWNLLDSVHSTINVISENLPEYAENLYKTAQEHGEKLKDTLSSCAEEVQKSYKGSKLQGIVDNLPEHTAEIYKTAKENSIKMKKAVEKYADDVHKSYQGSEFQKVANTLHEKVQEHGEIFTDTLEDYADKLSKNYEGSKLQKFVEKHVPEYAEKLIAKTEEHGEVLKEKLSYYCSEIKKNYEGSDLQKAVNEMYETVQVHATEVHKNYQGSNTQKLANELYATAKFHGEHLSETLSDYMGELQENRMNPFDCILGKLSSNKDISYKTMLAGGLIGAIRNSLRYKIRHGGRRSNIVSVFDNSIRNAKGNPKLFARVDMPHGKVPFPHINVNKAFTGVKDPHTRISEFTAKAAGVTGSALKFINRVAPAVMVLSTAYDAYDIVNSEDGGVMTKKVISGTSTSAGGYIGSSIGASIGTMFFPGIGTLTGSIMGGAYGGEFGDCFSDTLEDAYNYASDFWEIYRQNTCYPEFDTKKDEFFGLWTNEQQCIVGF
ncbi:hypothetical protein GCK72_008173 [Caenorhabditis remanei]|uniref:Uncharacterized protein n=1 Tax=Caenorhabditis remanei TaxID=31234 RepID=A0A6A5GWQ1_CAERE|nr:hypothetical protein GCK72_008173 [Caenorhabditis remanei]KAF1759928.1 hypothetical protein GCK72_008173 [Caenorhabditis remanei]